IPEDGMRNGYTLLNDEKDKLKDYLKEIRFDTQVTQAWKYSRLYRGGIVALITQNGPLDEPLPKTNPGHMSLRVYSAARIDIMDSDIVKDSSSPYFEDVEVFRIRSRSGEPLNIHRDRCMVFKGELVPDYNAANIELTYQYWGLSAIQKPWDKLKNLGTAEQGIANAMQEFSVGKYTLENLASILSMNNKDAIDKIITRLEAMNLSKSIMNAVLLGKNEEYSRDNITFAGIPDVMDRMHISVSSVTGIPVTKLFGRSAAGMNATGENDLRQYYDNVGAEQNEKVKPEMNRMINSIGQGVNGKGNYGIDEFNSLWEPTEKEKAETEKLKAEARKMYAETGKALLEAGLRTPEQVEALLFSEDGESLL
ncbi:DUF1073 domain-containing protein, partial [Candidatus Pacearchaeota archaeon]|nr:DUF1073 domain-containing protein [Candidatus Pacearchaeota archaeon]